MGIYRPIVTATECSAFTGFKRLKDNLLEKTIKSDGAGAKSNNNFTYAKVSFTKKILR